MSRLDDERLADVLDAITAIRSHLTRGDLSDGLVFDAVRVRLTEIGEAIKTLPPELLEHKAAIPWTDIARMRDRLAHRYFDTAHSRVAQTVQHDLEPLEAAVLRLQSRPQP